MGAQGEGEETEGRQPLVKGLAQLVTPGCCLLLKESEISVSSSNSRHNRLPPTPHNAQGLALDEGPNLVPTICQLCDVEQVT